MICDPLLAIACLLAILAVSFVTLRTQDCIVTEKVRHQDPALFAYMKGEGYDNDVSGMYGWCIAIRVIKGLRHRRDLTDQFRTLYRVYIVTAAITAVLMLALIVIAVLHDDLCILKPTGP